MTSALLLVAATLAAPGPKEAPSLVGTWALQYSITGGKNDDQPAGVTWAFTADGKSVITGPEGQPGGEGTFTTNPKASPAEFDVVDGPKAKRIVGIYKVEADTLTLCIAREANRPTKFEAPAGAVASVVVLKRVKK
jgi:uncharacterized protein (TIGR03067 family)